MAPRKLKKAGSKNVGSVAAPLGPLPPNGPIEVVFSFDTTGSMSGCIAEVKREVQDVIDRLFSDIPGLRIAVFAHGDYCDKNKYVTKWVDFSTDKKNLCDFVKNVSHTGGGDWEECYELVLRQVRQELSWTPGTQRSLVMIGDAIPHPKNDPQNKQKIDWKEETNKLRDEMGVKIYSVQCQYNDRAKSFWQDMAEITGGKHMKLEQFSTIIDMIMSICYRETGSEFITAYEKEVRAREGDKMRSELNLMFDALRHATPSSSGPSAPLPDSTTKLGKKPSLKRKPTTDMEEESITPLKKARSGKVAKKTTLKKKPSVIKKTSATASVRAASKLIKAAKKSSALKSKRVLRERVWSTKFIPSLEWSNWYPAFQNDKPSVAFSRWTERSNDHVGYRNKKLFYHDTKCAGVYELAVQPTVGCRKYPVWGTVTKGFNSVCWDTYLTRNQRIQKQIDDVVKRGSKIYVRRGLIKNTNNITMRQPDGADKVAKSVDELRGLVHEVYDYAWSVTRGKSSHRNVQKKGISISDA